MLTAILITLLLVAALAYALRSGTDEKTIRRHPYGNRHNDAAAARRDDLG